MVVLGADASGMATVITAGLLLGASNTPIGFDLFLNNLPFARATGVLAKTDRIDARILAAKAY